MSSLNYSKWDIRFLDLAKLVSSWSKDPSTKVGAVIVDSKNRIVSIGFNGFPHKIKDDVRLQYRDMKYNRIIHAECNAIMFANKPLEGCTIYTYPFQPCSTCASMIIQSGISRVVTLPLKEEYDRWIINFRMAQDLFLESNTRIDFIANYD
jgi:dCMP deaminase